MDLNKDKIEHPNKKGKKSLKNKYSVFLVPKIKHKKREGSIRILCFSDTHEHHLKIPPQMFPECDIVICAGDFTKLGSAEATKSFCEWFSSLKAQFRIVIAGNHELTFDDYKNKPMMQTNIEKLLSKTTEPLERSKEIMNEYKNDIIYLEDESVEVLGLKIYGSPSTNFWKEWGFYYPDEEMNEIWSKIPNDIDILITHVCPLSDLDFVDGNHAGCPGLRRAVERIQPSLHIFGHVHESYGVSKIGKTTIANVSILDKLRHVAHKPMLFELVKN